MARTTLDPQLIQNGFNLLLNPKLSLVSKDDPWKRLVAITSPGDLHTLYPGKFQNLNGSGVYIFRAIEKTFSYIEDSNIYYIGKAKTLRSRLANKLRNDSSPHVTNRQKSFEIFRYASSTFYEKYRTSVACIQVPAPSNENQKKASHDLLRTVEEILIASFHYTYGCQPIGNNSTGHPELWAVSRFSKQLEDVARNYF